MAVLEVRGARAGRAGENQRSLFDCSCFARERNESSLGAARRETSAFASTLRLREHLALRAPGEEGALAAAACYRIGLWKAFASGGQSDLAPELATAQKLVEQARRAAELEAEKDEDFPANCRTAARYRASAERIQPSHCGKRSGLSPSWNKDSRRSPNWTQLRQSRSPRPLLGITQNWPRIFALEKMPKRHKGVAQVGSGGTRQRIGTSRAPSGDKTPARACRAVACRREDAAWHDAWLFARERQ